MRNTKQIIALIPARGGSKGVPKKNIKLLGGYPLLAYSILAAQLSKRIDRVIVSTESDEIAAIAQAFGAEVPFKRPLEAASDTAADYPVIKHFVEWLQKHEGRVPDYIPYLRPTTPLRDPDIIDAGIDALLNNPKATSLRSSHDTEPAHKHFQIINGYYAGLFPDYPIKNYFDIPQQLLPKTYKPNGHIDVVRTKLIDAYDSVYGDKILPFVTAFIGDIDRQEDFDMVDFMLHTYQPKIYLELKKKYPTLPYEMPYL